MATIVGAQPAQEDKKIDALSKDVAKTTISPAEAPTAIGTSSAIIPPSTDKPRTSIEDGRAAKAQKQAEKAARRAKLVEGKAQAQNTAATSSTAGGKGGKGKSVDAKKNGTTKQEESSSSGKARPKKTGAEPSENSSPSKPKNQVLLFNHLPQRIEPYASSVAETKNVHLEIRALGLQMVEYMVCGSNSRLVALLAVLKTVIKEYKTPENQALTRHFIPRVLTPQITHLKSYRPLSVSQGNAIRWLKVQISKIDVEMPEDEAKEQLCESIDNFIRDKSTLAHQMISEQAIEQIKDGDVVLTYAKSTVVEKTIKKAWIQGKKFKLIIIDNGELLHEGKKMADSLEADKDMEGMEILQGPYLSISHYIEQATIVFLGAHAMMGNGSLYSRCGTAGIALEAYTTGIKVYVLCESVKFSERSPLTSLDMNELGPVEEVLDGTRLSDGEGMNGFNLMYDLTPAHWIDNIICEHGSVQPAAVPVLNRLHNEANEV